MRISTVKADILIGQSYYLRFDSKLWEAQQPYAPLGSLLAAAMMRQAGWRVAFFDAMLALSEQEWERTLEREKPRLAVLFEDNFNYLSKMCLLRMRKAAFTMIQMAKRHGCRVALCGADATDHAAEYLRQGADFVILGEGEDTLGELAANALGDTDKSYSHIPGLAFLAAGSNEPVFTARRPDIRDLDARPFPAWDLVDMEQYRQVWLKKHGYFSMNMVTTRGCPFHCNWCAKPIWGQRYHSRSPENVAREMKWLKQAYAPDHIWFADDILGLKPGWMAQFADCLAQNNGLIPFKSLSRADLLLRPGEIEALKRAGCQTVWLGAESGSQKILDAMEKGTRVEQIHEATRRLHAAGIQAGFFLQFGYPGETFEDIEKTFTMVRECAPDDIGASVSYPLPGTKFHEAVKDQLGTKQNWDDSEDLAMLYRGPYNTAFYRQLHRVLHREFRARKHRRELQSILSQPGRWRARHFKHAAYVALAPLFLASGRRRLKRLALAPHASVHPVAPQLTTLQAALPTPQAEP